MFLKHINFTNKNFWALDSRQFYDTEKRNAMCNSKQVKYDAMFSCNIEIG